MSIEFENILNFRDVGKTVNDYLGRKVVREGVLYRSARPDDATLDDRKRLTAELGIRTILDLRTKTEHLAQAKKRQADHKVPALLQSNAALAEPVQIPGLVYREVQVTGRRLERALLWQLSWWNIIKLIFLYLLGYRTQAIRILGQQVMQPLGLIGLSLVTLDESGPEIAEVRSIIPFPPLKVQTQLANPKHQALRALTSSETPPPVLVHCTQGKDRTGSIVALALMVLRVPTAAITHDYLLSQPGLEPEREARIAEIVRIGLTPEWGDCPPELIPRVRAHLDARYGGVDGYLDSIGFGAEDRARLVEVLGA